jgi:hypothetical protein
MKNQSIENWQLDIINQVYFKCHGLQSWINKSPDHLQELSHHTKISLKFLTDNYQTIKAMSSIESEPDQKRAAKKLDQDHIRFKQAIKAMGMTYKSLAIDLGLEYNSIKSMLAPAKELPKLAVAIVLTYEKLKGPEQD